MKIKLYTDGCCEPNPGSGSWAYTILNEDESSIIKSGTGYEKETTNNRMEYMALIEGIRYANEISKVDEIVAYSDSQLLVNTFNEWMHKWETKNWIRSSKGKKLEIKNLDLVKELFELKSKSRIKIKLNWVKGHSGNKWNEYCDLLCSQTIRKQGVSIDYEADKRYIEVMFKYTSKSIICKPSKKGLGWNKQSFKQR